MTNPDAGPSVCDFLLLAPFDGAADQGYANAQVLDTEAEGVAVGRLTVSEVDGTIALVSNECVFTAQTTPAWGDLGLYSPDAIARALGRAFLLKLDHDAIVTDRCGAFWCDNAGVATTDWIYNVRYHTAGALLAEVWNGAGGTTTSTTVGAVAANVEYDLAIVLGGYDTNGQPWYSVAVGTFLHGAAWFIKGGAFTDWTLIWRTTLMNTATLYPAFGNLDADGQCSYLRVPDYDYSAVLQPTVADWFTDANGTSLDAHTPDVDPGGGWTERVGNWQITGNEAVIAAQTDRACATMAAAIANVWGRDSLESNTADATTAGDSALVYRWVDNDNYWCAGINDAANAFRIVERNGGVETVRATAAVAIGTGTQYEVTIQATGNVHQAWLNGGNRLTHTSASHNTATVCGVRSKETTDAHDNFHVQPASGYTELDNCPGYAVTPVADPYLEKVLSYDPIAYFPLREISGTVAQEWINGWNGTYARDVSVMGTQAGIGDGFTAPTFDGTNDAVNVNTAGFRAAYGLAEMTVFGWAKVSGAGVWTDGADRDTYRFIRAGTNDMTYCRKNAANNEFRLLFRDVDTAFSPQTVSMSSTAWFTFAVVSSVAGGYVRYFINGVQQGADGTHQHTWGGAPTVNVIGAASAGPIAEGWLGELAHVAVFAKPLSVASLLDLSTV